MITRKIAHTLYYLFLLAIVLVNRTYGQSTDNLNFEFGDATGWTITKGVNKDATTMAGCCTVTIVPPAYFAIIDSTITQYDPNIPALRSFPRNGGRYNLRLGLTDVAAKDSSAMRAVKSFIVDQSKALLVIDYAAILGGSSPHTCSDQPYFQIRVLDPSSNPIACGKRNVIVANQNCTQKSDVSDFTNYPIPTPVGGNKGEAYFLSFTQWQRASYDLRDYIGQNVTVELTTASCRPAGHRGYVYFDTDCIPFQLTVNGQTEELDPNQMSAKSVTIQGCTDDSLNINIQAQKGFVSYLWSIPAGVHIDNVTSDSITTSQPGSYTVTMTPKSLDNTSAACKTTQVTINLNPPRTSPKGSLVLLNPDPEVCAENTLDFQSAIVSPGAGYSITDSTWIFDPLRVTDKGGGIFAFNKVGYDTIKFAVTNTAGCTNILKKVIRVKMVPNPPLVLNENPCQYTSLTVDGQNLKWYDADSNLLPATPVMTTLSFTPIIYFVTQSVENCESDKSKMSVITKFAPKITSIVKEDPDCYGYLKGSITVDVDNITTSNLLYKIIDFRNAQPFNYFKNVPPGKYLVQVLTDNSCMDTATVAIVPKNDDCELQMPSAFTPNHDGVNDIFRPASYSLLGEYSLQIFNRWGQVMYSASSPSEGWDGITGGELQPIGTYAWVVKYKNGKNEIKERSGTVVLIR